MAQYLDEKNSLDPTPTNIVAPHNFDVDFSTMRFAPQEYFNMATEGLKNTFGLGASPTPGPIQGLQEIPGPPPSFGGPIKGLQEIPASGPLRELHEMGYEQHPKAKPLIDAIDHGFADTKTMSAYEMIDQGVQLKDQDMIAKGHTKLADNLSTTNLGPWETLLDYAIGGGITHNAKRNANKIAADVVADAMQRHHGIGMPPVADAINAGLLQPNELTPAQQSPGFASLIPQEPFAMGPDGMPVSSVEMRSIPAQPGQHQVPPQQSWVNHTQNALMGARLTGASKGRSEHQTPEGIQLFNHDLQAQIDGFVETTGRAPSKAEYAEMVKEVRGRTEKEPTKGGLVAERLKGQTAKDTAETAATLEKTTTEKLMRPENLKETQAKTAELLSKMNLNITEASRAITRGLQSEYLAKIEAAKAGMAELKSQLQVVSSVFGGHDITPEHKLKLDQYMLDSVKSGLEIERRAGALGIIGLGFLDSGKQNANITQSGPPGSRIPSQPDPTQQALTMLPPANTGVDPTAFAPRSSMPGMQPMAPLPAPAMPDLIPDLPKNPETSKSFEAYKKLRDKGLSHAEAKKQLEGKK